MLQIDGFVCFYWYVCLPVTCRATVICAWGDDGAIARTSDGKTYSSPIFSPQRVIDTLAAGDTFNAATIYALSLKQSLEEAITFGCQVAGAKCGMKAFTQLKSWYDRYKQK